MFNQKKTDCVARTDQASTGEPAGISRRELLAWGSLLGLAPFAPFAAFADTYPSRPITLIVGGDTGGVIDFGARVISKPLSEILGVPVVIENRPGATGVISSKYVAKAPADGYTLLVATQSATVVGPQTQPKDAFNPLKDIVGINMVTKAPMAYAVNPTVKANNLKELIALSHTRPVTFGVAGVAGASDLIVKELSKFTGGKFESIPYKGMGAAISDAVGGQIDGVASDLGPFLPFHQSGRLKVLAVISDKRLELLPKVPAINETYPDFVVDSWFGLFAPANTPPDVIDKINAALLKIVTHDEGVKKQFSQSATAVTTMKSPAEFQAFVASEYKLWGTRLKNHGLIKS